MQIYPCIVREQIRLPSRVGVPGDKKFNGPILSTSTLFKSYREGECYLL